MRPLCTTKPDLFFSTDPEEVFAAVQMCKACPLVTECPDGKGESFGVWAGVPRGEQRLAYRKAVALIPGQRRRRDSKHPLGQSKFASAATAGRMKEVQRLTLDGLSARQIAERIGITERSVVRYRTALAAQMG